MCSRASGSSAWLCGGLWRSFSPRQRKPTCCGGPAASPAKRCALLLLSLPACVVCACIVLCALCVCSLHFVLCASCACVCVRARCACVGVSSMSWPYTIRAQTAPSVVGAVWRCDRQVTPTYGRSRRQRRSIVTAPKRCADPVLGWRCTKLLLRCVGSFDSGLLGGLADRRIECFPVAPCLYSSGRSAFHVHLSAFMHGRTCA